MATYPQYRAPRDNDRALVEPAWNEQLSWASARRGADSAVTLGGLPLGDLQSLARSELLGAATEYTAQYASGTQESVGPGVPLIVSGHQPELFHAGVWFKNFALDALAKASGGVGVHLLIDSDLCRAPSIRVPTGTNDAPRLATVTFDEAATAIPFEQRVVRDDARFRSFAERVVAETDGLLHEPLVGELWKHAIAARGASDLLGQVLSQARHVLERAWGSQTLELPFSTLADQEAFRRFAAELLLRADETREAYNAALDDYRRAHRVRSDAQPLPDLALIDGWIETPFWVWSDSDPTRRPLYARADAEVIELTDRSGWRSEAAATVDALVGRLADERAAGVKVRSRALATTLYCRLVVADLFLHGIGGAKYDQVTDRWAEALFGVDLPPHATLSATLRLPIEHEQGSPQEVRDARRRMRDLRYHPERFLTPTSPASAHEAAESKQRWIATAKTHANAAERHRAIEAANEAMADALDAERAEATRTLADAEKRLRNAALLGSREFSFCLFPADDVRERLSRLATPAPTADRATTSDA